MASDFQSSFIPKDTVTEGGIFKKKKTGILGILAVSLFVISILASIGLFIYKNIVKSDIQNLQTQVTQSETNIDKGSIDKMYQFSKKLNMARTLVLQHQVISNFLDVLASSTVSSVEFDSFNYGDMKGNQLTADLRGKATGYSSIALQENVFSQNKYFKSVSFSNLNLADKGMVSFDLAIVVDPQISAYSP